MEMDMTPKFSSKDEEIDFWKSLSLKYKNRYENALARIVDTLFFFLLRLSCEIIVYSLLVEAWGILSFSYCQQLPFKDEQQISE